MDPPNSRTGKSVGNERIRKSIQGGGFAVRERLTRDWAPTGIRSMDR